MLLFLVKTLKFSWSSCEYLSFSNKRDSSPLTLLQWAMGPFNTLHSIQWQKRKKKEKKQQTEITKPVPFLIPISLTTWGWGFKDFMTSISLSMSLKSFGEALSRSRIKSSREQEGRLSLDSTAKLDHWRANPANSDLSTISKIQLVVYYQYCVLIGWATSRLFVIAH